MQQMNLLPAELSPWRLSDLDFDDIGLEFAKLARYSRGGQHYEKGTFLLRGHINWNSLTLHRSRSKDRPSRFNGNEGRETA